MQIVVNVGIDARLAAELGIQGIWGTVLKEITKNELNLLIRATITTYQESGPLA